MSRTPKQGATSNDAALAVIDIDPNVRVYNNETYSGYEDIHGDFPRVGDAVTVREPESNVVGSAIVTSMRDADQLIYLKVDWPSLRQG